MANDVKRTMDKLVDEFSLQTVLAYLSEACEDRGRRAAERSPALGRAWKKAAGMVHEAMANLPDLEEGGDDEVWQGEHEGVPVRVRRMDDHNLIVEQFLLGEWSAADDETASAAYQQCILQRLGPEGVSPLEERVREEMEALLKEGGLVRDIAGYAKVIISAAGPDGPPRETPFKERLETFEGLATSWRNGCSKRSRARESWDRLLAALARARS